MRPIVRYYVSQYGRRDKCLSRLFLMLNDFFFSFLQTLFIKDLYAHVENVKHSEAAVFLYGNMIVWSINCFFYSLVMDPHERYSFNAATFVVNQPSLAVVYYLPASPKYAAVMFSFRRIQNSVSSASERLVSSGPC